MADYHFDLIIRGARVIDPASGVDAVSDVAVRDGTIVVAGTPLPPGATADEEVDGSGLVCTPGLVDLHVHVYEHATPLGVNPDHFCLGRGVTTVVDAGANSAPHGARMI